MLFRSRSAPPSYKMTHPSEIPCRTQRKTQSGVPLPLSPFCDAGSGLAASRYRYPHTVCEVCTHHRQCEDIGTVKLPNWIRKHTGKELNFEFTSGTEFPLDLQKYRLIIHCGGCTLNEREMRYRQKCAEDAAVPMTNYGTAIAYMKGILERSIAVFQSKDCFI